MCTHVTYEFRIMALIVRTVPHPVKEEIEGEGCVIQCWISNGESLEDLWLPRMPSTSLTETVKPLG